MKKIVFLLIGAISLLTIVFSNRVYAQGAGGSCCPGGSVYISGKCYETFLKTACDGLAFTLCGLPLVATGLCNVDLLGSACLTAATGGGLSGYAVESTCRNFLNLGNIIADSSSVDRCTDAARIITQGIPLPSATSPQCNAGLSCNSSGICESSSATGGTGSTIPVYDPTCGGFDPQTHTGFTGVKTALGCLPTDPQQFVNTALPWSIFLGAGIAFLLGVFGSLMIVLSAGNPEKMQAGKEMITSAIAGVIILVFAVFLLDFIGVKVLKLFSF